jgi:hypothetical protein
VLQSFYQAPPGCLPGPSWVTKPHKVEFHPSGQLPLSCCKQWNKMVAQHTLVLNCLQPLANMDIMPIADGLQQTVSTALATGAHLPSRSQPWHCMGSASAASAAQCSRAQVVTPDSSRWWNSSTWGQTMACCLQVVLGPLASAATINPAGHRQ